MVWKYPPTWWSRECKHPWRNPTASKQKDTVQILRDKFICLEQHLRKENKIPDDMIPEITEWKENRLPNLFFLTYISSLLGKCRTLGILLNKPQDKQIEHSNYISNMIAELFSSMEENMQKIKDFVEKQKSSLTLEPTLTSPSRSTLQKRDLEAISTADECLYPPAKKRPRQSSLSPSFLHSESSPSSPYATSSPCTQMSNDILNSIRNDILSSASNPIEITPQELTPTNLLVQPASVDNNPVKSTMVNKQQHPPVYLEIFQVQPSISDNQSFQANYFEALSAEDNHSVTSDEAYHSDTPYVENPSTLPSQAEHLKMHFSESECLDTLTTDADNNSAHSNDTSISKNVSATSNMSLGMEFNEPEHLKMSPFNNAVTSFSDTSWEEHSMSYHHSINSSVNSSSLAQSQVISSPTNFSRMDCYGITVQSSTSDVLHQSGILSGNISPHPTDTSALENALATSKISLQDENDSDDLNTFLLSPESQEVLSSFIKILDEEDIFSSVSSPSSTE
ncbi:hypothetical protein C0Q70_19344 [Pomacea canaliculata]|uniref:Uncharacterized protein n=2 Tax=Pomacea canaliculata TaxID=400727 RepID=A0A2T7NJ36_POMCA|nr:hypothetical protein C0Q70_19344 [Pomacea canaliculata]